MSGQVQPISELAALLLYDYVLCSTVWSWSARNKADLQATAQRAARLDVPFQNAAMKNGVFRYEDVLPRVNLILTRAMRTGDHGLSPELG